MTKPTADASAGISQLYLARKILNASLVFILRRAKISSARLRRFAGTLVWKREVALYQICEENWSFSPGTEEPRSPVF